jgi:hypothetical protein
VTLGPRQFPCLSTLTSTGRHGLPLRRLNSIAFRACHESNLGSPSMFPKSPLKKPVTTRSNSQDCSGCAV